MISDLASDDACGLCDKPAVTSIAGVPICAPHQALVNAIAADNGRGIRCEARSTRAKTIADRRCACGSVLPPGCERCGRCTIAREGAAQRRAHAQAKRRGVDAVRSEKRRQAWRRSVFTPKPCSRCKEAFTPRSGKALYCHRPACDAAARAAGGRAA